MLSAEIDTVADDIGRDFGGALRLSYYAAQWPICAWLGKWGSCAAAIGCKLPSLREVSVNRRTLSIIVSLLLLSSQAICGAIKSSDWQTGTLTDVASQPGSRMFGTAANGHGTLGQARYDATFYTIEAGKYVYVAKRTLLRYHDKQLAVTVNAPIKFAVKKNDFYLLDEDGKEHKLTLEKKTLLK